MVGKHVVVKKINDSEIKEGSLYLVHDCNDELFKLIDWHIVRLDYAGDGQGFTYCTVRERSSYVPVWRSLGLIGFEDACKFTKKMKEGYKTVKEGKKRRFLTNEEMQVEFDKFKALTK